MLSDEMSKINTPIIEEDGEKWTYIPKTNNKYSVSSHGRVYSHKRAIYLKPTISGNGYCSVCIRELGSKSIKVHRLVALVFLDLPLKCKTLEINHKDGNKQNNNLDNLEVVTHSQNIRHAIDNGLWDYQTKRRPENLCLITNRLRFLATEILGLYPCDFIKEAGLYSSILSRNTNSLQRKTVDKIISTYHVNPDWIIYGIKPIFINK